MQLIKLILITKPMDYELIGIHTNKKDSLYNGNNLIENGNLKYEYKDIQINQRYRIEGNTLFFDAVEVGLKRKFTKIVLNSNYLFVCYQMHLEIYNQKGEIIRKIESKERIILGTEGFLIQEDVFYILNLHCNSIIIDQEIDGISISKLLDDILDFTDNGIIALKKDGFFAIKSPTNQIIVYSNQKSEEISIDDLKVYKDTCIIKCPISCVSVKLKTNSNNESEPIHCFIVLDESNICFVYNDLIVKKSIKCKNMRILRERFVLHDYTKEVDLIFCIFLINCYRSTNIFDPLEVEKFLLLLFLKYPSFQSNLTDVFLTNFKSYMLETNRKDLHDEILCRVYRQIDDSSKKFLASYIDFDSLTVDNLTLVIIYMPELVSKFVSLCVKFKRLFYLDDLIDFYEKTNRLEELRPLLLENNLLILEYPGFEELIKSEREEIRAQELTFKSSTYDIAFLKSGRVGNGELIVHPHNSSV